MNLQEEQDLFQREIENNYISLFDVAKEVQSIHSLNMNEACLFLLTRIDTLMKRNALICYELVDPPFKKYSLDIIDTKIWIDMLQYSANNGRFRSEKKAKKYALVKGLILPAIHNDVLTIQNPTNRERVYHPSERETHLQMIAILAEELAKAKGGKYKKANGLPNNSALANIIQARAKEIEIESIKTNSVDTYRRRLTEISKFYKGE